MQSRNLNFRMHRPEDLEDCYQMWSHPDVIRYIGGKPSSRQQCWMRMLQYAGMWQFRGYGYWAMECRNTGRFVGEAGFADFQRGLGGDLDLLPEIGWALCPEFHGNGLGSEAVQALVQWADAQIIPRTFCIINRENVISRKIALKSGYISEGMVELNKGPVEAFSRRLT